MDWSDDSFPLVMNETNLAFMIGAHSWDEDSPGNTMRKFLAVEKIIIHPNWNVSDTLYGDIALVKLTESVDLDVFTPVCLPKQDSNYEGKMAVAVGWGKMDYDVDEYSDVLNEVEVPVVSDETCRESHIAQGKVGNESLTILDVHLCAGGEEGKDACTGDSGGPLMVEEDGRYELIGATSFGYGCAEEGLYGVYTEIAKYTNWIEQQFAENGGAVMCD